MRCIAIAIVVGMLGSAHADDGYYVADSFGSTTFHGGLRAYGKAGVRGQGGVEFRTGDRALYFLGGAVDIDPGYVDCSGAECSIDTSRNGGWMFAGFDVKQRWHLFPSRCSRIGVRVALHAGPRYIWGEDAMTGYAGLGLNGGAALEWDIGVIGFFVDAGVDVMYLSMPVDSVSGSAPYFSFGGKVGWL